MTNVLKAIEAMEQPERVALKLSAKSIKDEVLNRAPQFCKNPYEGLLDELCKTAAFDDLENGNVHDGDTLGLVCEMLDGWADRLDVRAINAMSDETVNDCRTEEEGYRELSKVVQSMRDDEFKIARPAPVAYVASTPTP